MGQVEKSVFISYRRTNLPWALNIYQNLTAHGYDVFFDYESINSGDFEQIILENIRSRAHFLVILTPSMLERIDEPNDWVRREIETALDEKRNIVSLFFEGFDFSDPSIAGKLTGKLELLKKYAGFDVPASYFGEAMDRLRNRYLNVSLDVVKHPVSSTVQKATQKQQVAASKAPPAKEKELTAQEWFEKGYKAEDLDEKIHCYSEAIRLEPDYVAAYNNRGIAYYDKGNFEDAIKDYDEALSLKLDFANAYNGRGAARYKQGDLKGALEDYEKSISLAPDGAAAYVNRGIIRKQNGDLTDAIRDYDEAVRLKPDFAEAYLYRGVARKKMNDIDGAIKDYNEAIRLEPNYAMAYYDRGIAFSDKGNLDGAIEDYKNAIRLKLDYIDAYWGRGAAYSKKGDYSSAAADYQKYFDFGGTDERVREYLTDAKKKAGIK